MLKGVGAMMGLPLLEAMSPLKALCGPAQAQSKYPVRIDRQTGVLLKTRLFAGFNRNLVKNVGTIPAKGLPCRGWFVCIEGAGIGNYGTPNCETALFLND